MKILSILAASPPFSTPGGAELQKHSLHKGLRSRGIDVHVLAEIKCVAKQYQEFEGVPVWGASFPVFTSHALRPGNVKLIGNLLKISRLVKKQIGRIDLIHATTFRETALIGACLAKQLDVPLVVSLECSGTYGDFSYVQNNWLLRLGLSAIIRQTSAVVALDEETFGEAVAHEVTRDKLKVIANAMVINPVRLVQNDPNLSKAGNLIYVGRIASQKRVDTLIASVAELVGMGAGRKLVMVGGGNLAWLKAEIEKHRLDQWVEVIGFDPHPESHFNNAACFINPSESEGMPGTVVEACAFGIPVILSDIPAHRVIAKAVGMENFLFSVGDAASLSKKIVELFNLPEAQYAELKRKCAAFGRGFTTEKRDHAYIQLYENVLLRYRKRAGQSDCSVSCRSVGH